MDTGDGILGTNMYAYCQNDPVNGFDPSGSKSIWSLKSDWAGREILWHWLFGKGQTYVVSEFIGDGEKWAKYIMDNASLKKQMQEILFPIGNSLKLGESRKIDFTESIAIDNGEDIIGYQYLHGTNAYAGGFKLYGEISKDKGGNITYDIRYNWNDKIDPNFMYDSDSKKAAFANMIANPADYIIRIFWRDKSVIGLNGKGTGWLS